LRIIGIDPGQKGGIAYMATGCDIAYAMPDSPQGIITLLNCWPSNDTVMIVELAQTMPKQGVVSAFTYGRHFGGFEWYAYMRGIKYIEVRPAKWKKDMGLNSDKINSIKLCQRLFPTIELVQKGCRKPHDGMAEALLIAEWKRRQVINFKEKA
jgi:crossover junction endodeoxyribonuclease RuvC